MSKDTSTSLFELIHRMSKGEKRYFKLQAAQIGDTGKLKFVKLFDRIEKQHVYDEAALLKLEPDITRKQLPNLKTFYTIICSLVFSNCSSSIHRLHACSSCWVMRVFFTTNVYMPIVCALPIVQSD